MSMVTNVSENHFVTKSPSDSKWMVVPNDTSIMVMPNTTSKIVTSNAMISSNLPHNFKETSPDTKESAQWSPEEIDRLQVAMKLMTERNDLNWSQVAKLVNSKSQVDCEKKWKTLTRQVNKRIPWTIEEENWLIEALKIYGTRWTKLAVTNTTNRSVVEIKNKFYSTYRSTQRSLMMQQEPNNTQNMRIKTKENDRPLFRFLTDLQANHINSKTSILDTENKSNPFESNLNQIQESAIQLATKDAAMVLPSILSTIPSPTISAPKIGATPTMPLQIHPPINSKSNGLDILSTLATKNRKRKQNPTRERGPKKKQEVVNPSNPSMVPSMTFSIDNKLLCNSDINAALQQLLTIMAKQNV